MGVTRMTAGTGGSRGRPAADAGAVGGAGRGGEGGGVGGRERAAAAGPVTDEAALAADAPLLAAFLTATERGDMPFVVPGHKRRATALDAGLGLVTDTDIA